MQITMLGTGHATVTKYYNTCFSIKNNGQYLLVDGGGGNTLLRQLELAGIGWKNIHHIFITHKHLDHLLGILWMVRMAAQAMNKGAYHGELFLYGHDEVIKIIHSMSETLLQKKESLLIGQRIHFVQVEDADSLNIIGTTFTFFDIHSKKAKQFGFCMDIGNGEKLTCCGDEPYNDSEYAYAKNCKWLLHEAFCLYSEAEMFQPYEKHHSTVKDACELAEKLHVANLILYHTEDKNAGKRRQLYLAEGKSIYNGNLIVPEDLETILIS